MPGDKTDPSASMPPQLSSATLSGAASTIIPQWVWVFMALTGAGASGGIGSVLGGQAAAEDLIRLREQLDELDSKMDKLTIQIVRYHANDPRLDPEFLR